MKAETLIISTEHCFVQGKKVFMLIQTYYWKPFFYYLICNNILFVSTMQASSFSF